MARKASRMEPTVYPALATHESLKLTNDPRAFQSAPHTKISEMATATQLDSIERASIKRSIGASIRRLIVQKELCERQQLVPACIWIAKSEEREEIDEHCRRAIASRDRSPVIAGLESAVRVCLIGSWAEKAREFGESRGAIGSETHVEIPELC